MRTIWTIISVLALANLLALAGFLTWLSTSDRMNRDRVEKVRLLFKETLSAEQDRLAQEKAKAEQEAKAAEQAAKLAVPPETATTVISRLEESDQVRMQHLLRLEQEQRLLKESLDRMRASVEEDRSRLEKDKQDFEAYRKRLADTEGSEQFKKALDTLQGQKPKEAHDVLQEMIAGGKTEQAVSYLSSMDDRARTRVIAEFVKTDKAVAADLLERLRTRGVALPPSTEIAQK